MQPVCWDKLYRSDLLKHIHNIADVKVGPDFLLNITAFSYAISIGYTPCYTCRWTYNGLGQKYYLENWDDYVECLRQAYKLLPEVSYRIKTEPDESSKWLAAGCLRNLRESCVQRILHGYKDEEILTVIRDTCREFDFVPDTDAVLFLAESRRHLRNHRKFYNFTRLINLLS